MKKQLFFITIFLISFCTKSQINTTISQIQSNHPAWNNINVTVEGVVVEGAGILSNFSPSPYLSRTFIADSTGAGLSLFSQNFNIQDSMKLISGNKVRVTGIVNIYNNNWQISFTNITVISNELANIENYSKHLTIAQANDTLTFESFYVTLEGEVKNKINSPTFGYHVWLKQGIDSIDLYVFQNATANINFQTWVLNSCVKVRGIVSSYNSFPELYFGYLEDYDLCTRINNNDISSEFNLFPNPASNKLSINLTNQNVFQNTTVSIYDIQGKMLIQQNIQQQLTELNISYFTKGIYILKVNNDKEIYTNKFIKQ